jgi:nitronate monooxygenase
MWNKTKVSSLLNIDYPIIQGPFGGRFSTVKLASTASNLGGMGSFGLNAYSAKEIKEVDTALRKSTAKPYALNLWVPLKKDPALNYTVEEFERLRQKFGTLFEKVDMEPPIDYQSKAPKFENQIEAMIEAAPPVASFIFGFPDEHIIKALRKRGSKVIGTATSVEEAVYIQDAGADIVVATGNAAGGHRAAFLNTDETKFMETPELLEKVLKTISIPIIAAGGISTSKDIAQMFQLGAGAVQLGTVFLATNESGASQYHRARMFTEGYQTKLTKVFTGRYGRVISTPFVESFKKEDEVAPYPLQSSFLAPLRKKLEENGNKELMALWAGQPSAPIKYKSAAQLFKTLVKELDLMQG